MDNESVLKKIEELMLQRGYTRYMLAKVSGISKSTITTIFNRRSTMSLYNLSKVCRAFDLTLSEFFSMLEGKTENGLLQDFPLAYITAHTGGRDSFGPNRFFGDKTGYDFFYRIRRHAKLGYCAEGSYCGVRIEAANHMAEGGASRNENTQAASNLK